MTSQYDILDSGDGQKLEQIGPFRLLRPAAGAVWSPSLKKSEWDRVDASFQRFAGGDGEWKIKNPKIKKPWSISVAGIKFKMQLTDFGHVGIFPEQASNWQRIQDLIKSNKRKEIKVMNLFAYTGGSTMASALAGAQVTHVDASKTSVAWARENMQLNDSELKLPVRWIVEDVQKYVTREIKRGQKYQGIILDPPSFGRGVKGEVWKIEEHMMPFMKQLKQLTDDSLEFILLSSHSQGYTALALENILAQVFGSRFHFQKGEMILPRKKKELQLPTGASCLLTRKSGN